MIFITFVISTNEWIKLREQAIRCWPGEALSGGEVLYRLSLIGCDRIAEGVGRKVQGRGARI